MTEAEAALGMLQRAVDQLRSLVSRLTADQASLPTPCAAWDVRALVVHATRSARSFAAAARGADAPGAADAAPGDGWRAELGPAATDLLAAWREPGALERPVRLPGGTAPARWRFGQQTVEFTVHAWDLARATGEAHTLDPELAELALAWGRENLRPAFRGPESEGMAFGPEVPVAAGSDPYARLAGFFGRDPSAPPAP